MIVAFIKLKIFEIIKNRTIIGNFIMVQLNPVIHGGSGGAPQTPAVFMDNPEF